MINDIQLSLQKSEIILFEEDVVIYFLKKDADIIEKHLNEDISQLGTWFIDNKLIVNLNKKKTE